MQVWFLMELRRPEEASCSTQSSCRPCSTTQAPVTSQACHTTEQQQLQKPAAAAGSMPGPGRRRGRQQGRSALLGAVLVAAVLQSAACAEVRMGDAQDRAFEDLSVLARAGQLITGAMVDAVTAISAGTKLPPLTDKVLQSGPVAPVPDCHAGSMDG